MAVSRAFALNYSFVVHAENPAEGSASIVAYRTITCCIEPGVSELLVQFKCGKIKFKVVKKMGLPLIKQLNIFGEGV